MKTRIFSLITSAALLMHLVSVTAITSSAEIISSSDTTTSVSTDYKISTSANAEEMWNFLLSKIGNPYGVAAILGNLYAESGLRSNNLENGYESKIGYNDTTYTNAVDNGTYTNFVKDACGYGLAQWTYWSRKQNLLNYAKNTGRSIGDMQMQLEFLVSELSSGYKSVYNTIKNATSIKQASDAFLTGFERPANMGDSVKNYRASLSQGYYDSYADTSTPPASDNDTTGNPIYKVSASIGSNVRSGPSTSYGVVGASPCGSTFIVSKIEGEWGYTDSITTTNGVKSGWVHLGYCELIGYDGEAHQHSYSKTLIQNATCTQVGIYKYTCSCGDFYTENTSFLAHSFSSSFTVDVKATCTTDGRKSRHCTACTSAVTDVTIIPATGHNGDYVKQFPTCTEDGYEIFSCYNCDFTETTHIGAYGHRDYIITTVAPSYFEQGYTLNKCGHCNYSYKDSYTDNKVLPAISGFGSASRNYESITLSWTKNTSASGYIIQQMKNGVWTNIANIKNNATTSYKISGLNASTKYQFRAVAYITSGGKTAYSKYTSALSVTTSSIPKPSIVTGLKVTTSASNSISLSWNKVSASGYIVQCLKNNVWVNVANIKDSATVSHKVTGLYENSSYKFRVVAYNKAGTSTVYGTYSSAVASRTSPAAVKNLRMTNRGTDFISVRWEKNEKADGYMVYIYDGTGWKLVKTLTTASSVSHKITGLESAKAYKVTVKAYKTVNGTKYISDTATVSANTL